MVEETDAAASSEPAEVDIADAESAVAEQEPTTETVDEAAAEESDEDADKA